MSVSPSTIDPLSINALRARFFKIADQDPASACLFTARYSWRIMPLLAENLFEFWRGTEDNRAHHLLAVWRTTLAPYFYLVSSESTRASTAIRAASRAEDNESEYAVRVAAYAILAAAYAGDSDATTVIERANETAYKDVHINDVPELLHDLDILENNLSLTNIPLWQETDQSYIDSFSKAISRLADEERVLNSVRADLLENLSIAYEQISKGKYLNISAQEFLIKLDNYFNNADTVSIDLKPIETTTKKTLKKTKKAPNTIEKNEKPISETDINASANLTPKSTESSEPIIQYTATLQQSSEQTSKEDHLDRQQLINALAAILAHPNNNEHRTIGLLGDWGSGKSTWLDFLRNALKTNHQKDQSFCFGEFNAWAYEHTSNLQAGIAQEMIKALVNPPANMGFLQQQWWKLKLKANVAVQLHGWLKMAILFSKFIMAILPASLLSFFIIPLIASNNSTTPTTISIVDEIKNILVLGAGILSSAFLLQKLFWSEFKNIVASPHAKELLTYLRLPDYAKHLGEIPEMRRTLEKFCRTRLQSMEATHSRMLFVVDDLDRCTPEGIVKVLEAVRLVLGIENVTVIIAVDQHIALAALALHYKDLALHHKLANPRAIARDYLAKVIHLPITLTNPKDHDIKNYLEKLWEATEPKIKEKNDDIENLNTTKTTESQNGEQLIPSNNTPNDKEIIQDNFDKNSPPQIIAPQSPETKNSGKEPTNTKESKVSKVEKDKNIGLTPNQKPAFIKWVNYFELTNPRQLKRLNNTYSLMLSANLDLDQKAATTVFNDTRLTDTDSYPILIALIAMEYLNALDNQPLRKILKARLQDLEITEEFDSKGEKKITPISNLIVSEEFIIFFTKLSTEAGRNLIKTVEPFVLPAIEC